jgi:hypothetical protein
MYWARFRQFTGTPSCSAIVLCIDIASATWFTHGYSLMGRAGFPTFRISPWTSYCYACSHLPVHLVDLRLSSETSQIRLPITHHSGLPTWLSPPSRYTLSKALCASSIQCFFNVSTFIFMWYSTLQRVEQNFLFFFVLGVSLPQLRQMIVSNIKSSHPAVFTGGRRFLRFICVFLCP